MDVRVNSPVKQYHQLGIQTSVEAASPHELIDLLICGARDRLRQAQGCLTRGDMEGKGTAVNSCVDILLGLQSSLDHSKGGEIAENLDALYDYMQRRLFRAHADNDPSGFVEVDDLLSTIRSAWIAIAPEANGSPAQAS